VTSDAAYELVLTPPAARAVAGKLPKPVATAVIDFMTTELLTNPYRVLYGWRPGRRPGGAGRDQA
jgi:hypothetical protein